MLLQNHWKTGGAIEQFIDVSVVNMEVYLCREWLQTVHSVSICLIVNDLL